MKYLSKKGFGLLEPLVAVPILSLLVIGVGRGISQANSGQINVRKRSIFQEGVASLRLAFKDRASCASTGLVGTSITSTTLNLHTPDEVFSFSNGQILSNYTVSSVEFRSLKKLTSGGAGGLDTYFSKIHIGVDPINAKQGLLPLGRDFYLKLDVDPSNNIIRSCHGADSHIYRSPKTCENASATCNLYRNCQGDSRCLADGRFPAAVNTYATVFPGPAPSKANKWTMALCPIGMHVLSCNAVCKDSTGLFECTAMIQAVGGEKDNACFTACINRYQQRASPFSSTIVDQQPNLHGANWDGGNTGSSGVFTSSTKAGNNGCSTHKAVFTCTPN